MKILVTGFEPFGGESINPSWEAIKLLPDNIKDNEIIKLEIPTVFRRSLEYIEGVIIDKKPDVILSIGQASGRAAITIERVAINIDDARIKDNEGNQPIDKTIYDKGEAAYFSNLPIKAMVERIKEGGIPASISNSAGTFVCNHVLYGILHLINKRYKKMMGGFIHVPCIPEQVVNKSNIPSMSLDKISKALEISIIAIIENKEDIKFTGGAIC